MKKTLLVLVCVLILVISGYLYISGKVSLFSPFPMNYTLEKTSVNGVNNNQNLATTVNSNIINFEIMFVDGAGSNDSAKLKSFMRGEEKVLNVQLHDTDFVRQKMLIGYTLKGSISKVPKGHYVLEIVNSDNKVLGSKELEVR
jgi:hypothetical protein